MWDSGIGCDRGSNVFGSISPKLLIGETPVEETGLGEGVGSSAVSSSSGSTSSNLKTGEHQSINDHILQQNFNKVLFETKLNHRSNSNKII